MDCLDRERIPKRSQSDYHLQCIHFPFQLIWSSFLSLSLFFTVLDHILLFILNIFTLTMSGEVLKPPSL